MLIRSAHRTRVRNPAALDAVQIAEVGVNTGWLET